MKALISRREDGRIVDVKPDNLTYETHPDLFWIDCDNDVTKENSIYNLKTNTIDAYTPDSNDDDRFSVARMVAYGEIGSQLDMLYHELEEKGSIDTNGEWFNHIKNVKQNVTRDNT